MIITLKEAYEKLKAEFPNKHCSVKAEMNDYTGEGPKVSWACYNEERWTQDRETFEMALMDLKDKMEKTEDVEINQKL